MDTFHSILKMKQNMNFLFYSIGNDFSKTVDKLLHTTDSGSNTLKASGACSKFSYHQQNSKVQQRVCTRAPRCNYWEKLKNLVFWVFEVVWGEGKCACKELIAKHIQVVFEV